MKEIKGLYIEDEIDNISTYSRFFKREGMQIISTDTLLDSPDKYYDLICKHDIDFVIIDNHLDKSGVGYDGFDVLKEIRKQDSNIYILLLTNFDFEDREGLGELDQAVNKEKFKTQFKEIIERIKRAHERKESKEVTDEIKQKLDFEINKTEQEISKLDGINEKLEKLISIQNKSQS